MVTAIANMPGYRAGTLGLPYQSIEETRRGHGKTAPGSLRVVAVIDEQIIGYAGLRRHARPSGFTRHALASAFTTILSAGVSARPCSARSPTPQTTGWPSNVWI